MPNEGPCQEEAFLSFLNGVLGAGGLVTSFFDATMEKAKS
jgi:hypothetical protein